MGWFKKSKEELAVELENYNSKYKHLKGKYLKVDDMIFKLLGFDIGDGKLSIKFGRRENPKNCYSSMSVTGFKLKCGTIDFEKMRNDYLYFESELLELKEKHPEE